MMKDQDPDIVERLTQNLYYTTSRRGFLSTFGKALLGFVGVAITEVLPVDRMFKEVEASHWPSQNNDNKSCNYWKYCNINTGSPGWPPCPCCSQPDCQCPYGTLPGSGYWIGCCHNLSGAIKKIAYYDCCKSLPNVQCFKICDPRCHNHKNNNGANSHTPGGAGSYYHDAIWCTGQSPPVICTAACIIGSSC